MRIKVVSDLHLEFSRYKVLNTQKYDVLVLSGDIALADSIITFTEFFEQVSAEFPLVIYIMGNHEFYHGKWYSSIDKVRNFLKKYPNIKLLENDSTIFDNVGFVGCTLWSDIAPSELDQVKSYMNDYRQIRNDKKDYRVITPLHTMERHRESLQYIKTEVERLHKSGIEKIVVTTHHAPSYKSIPEQFKNSEVNSAYYTNLEQYIIENPCINVWTHGHSHYFQDYTVGSTRVVCNPRGYQSYRYQEETMFDENFIVEL